MNGAYVNIDIKRDGGEAYIEADAACAGDVHYNEQIHGATGEPSDPIRAFLIVDGSHLKMNAADCYLYTPVYK